MRWIKLTLLFWTGTIIANITLPLHPSPQEAPVTIAKAFLPPQAKLLQIENFDPRTGKLKESHPAVLTGHIVSEKSQDVVVAYFAAATKSTQDVLFIALLHRTEVGYAKVYELTYYGKRLWVQDFETVGLKMLRLPGAETDSVAVVTGIGALLGGRLQVLTWDHDQGLKDIMPANGGVHHFALERTNDTLKVTLAFERYPGDKESPAPLVYLWKGGRFEKVP